MAFGLVRSWRVGRFKIGFGEKSTRHANWGCFVSIVTFSVFATSFKHFSFRINILDYPTHVFVPKTN